MRYFKKTEGTMLQAVAKVKPTMYIGNNEVSADEYITELYKRGFTEISETEYKDIMSYDELAIEYIY